MDTDRELDRIAALVARELRSAGYVAWSGWDDAWIIKRGPKLNDVVRYVIVQLRSDPAEVAAAQALEHARLFGTGIIVRSADGTFSAPNPQKLVITVTRQES